MSGTIKVIKLRRWNWCPWFTYNMYVPIPNCIDVGQKTPAYSSMAMAEVGLSLMETRDALKRIKEKLS